MLSSYLVQLLPRLISLIICWFITTQAESIIVNSSSSNIHYKFYTAPGNAVNIELIPEANIPDVNSIFFIANRKRLQLGDSIEVFFQTKKDLTTRPTIAIFQQSPTTNLIASDDTSDYYSAKLSIPPNTTTGAALATGQYPIDIVTNNQKYSTIVDQSRVYVLNKTVPYESLKINNANAKIPFGKNLKTIELAMTYDLDLAESLNRSQILINNGIAADLGYSCKSGKCSRKCKIDIDDKFLSHSKTLSNQIEVITSYLYEGVNELGKSILAAKFDTPIITPQNIAKDDTPVSDAASITIVNPYGYLDTFSIVTNGGKL